MAARVQIGWLSWRLGLVAAAAAYLVFHSVQYNFVTDDAYISFVYSRNFAEHGSLVFNLGEPVEGYTNFLWTFVLGVLMWVGIPPEIASLVLGTAFGAATLVVCFRLVDHIVDDAGAWPAVPGLVLAASAGYACWSSGGLETQMFTFFVTLAIHEAIRSGGEPTRFPRVGVALALAAMTRPEGLLVTAVVAVHRLVWIAAGATRGTRPWRPSRPELLCAAAFLVVWAPWFVWRWHSYGHLFPNTYYVKAAGDAAAGYQSQMTSSGLYYVYQWLSQTRLLWAAPVVVLGLVAARPRSPWFSWGTLSASIACVYIVYTIRVGGDFMGLHRFVMPLFVIAALAVTLGAIRLVRLLPAGRRRAAVGATAVAALVVGFGVDQFRLTVRSLTRWSADRGIDTPGYLWVYAHDRALIGRHMRDCFRPDDFSVFGGVGAKPYYARARGIDVFGLVSERIAHEVPRTRARPGHNKWGPDPLLAEYEPEFVFSCYTLHKQANNRPRLPCAGFWTRRGFEQVTLHIPGLLERGEYYSFLVRKDRGFSCPGMVK